MVIAWSKDAEADVSGVQTGDKFRLKSLAGNPDREAYSDIIDKATEDTVLLVDTDRFALKDIQAIINAYFSSGYGGEVGYLGAKKGRKDFIIWCSRRFARDVVNSPVVIGPKREMAKAYTGSDIGSNPAASAAYSLSKQYVKFIRLDCTHTAPEEVVGLKEMSRDYNFRVPFRSISSGDFFSNLLKPDGSRRDMAYRLLFFCFAVAMFIYMPLISLDYGISGDEFVDHRHSEYVLDYFAKGDPAALDQPKTNLHNYGISVQVIAAGVCRLFGIDSHFEVRHMISALIGALGILFTGLLARRWGGGLCGLLAMVMMFLTPRFFGHSMNNLKDVPFAVGYIVSIYYTVRLFDFFPRFRLRDMAGLTLGVALTLGTRSGGLILYPMLLMYGGLFYLIALCRRRFAGVRQGINAFLDIAIVIALVAVASYALSIALWPFALQDPFGNVILSLKQFTKYEIALWTLFEGEQMLSNNLPWYYAPKYLMIGMPLVSVLSFAGYLLWSPFRRKEYSLIGFFLLFAAIFPVFWVIYKESNLYGGIRHLLFVMPPMVILGARFWTLLIHGVAPKLKVAVIVIFAALLSLPAAHAVRNHPNDYVYFNELAGGMKGAYGNYDTDYYYNSLKESAGWFRANIDIPAGDTVIVATNHDNAMKYYFRDMPNVKVVYARYYARYGFDWDYSIYANVYIEKHQLQNGMFPPPGTIYTADVDGRPMSYVAKRVSKEDLKGYQLEKEGRKREAIDHFRWYLDTYGDNEEIWERLARLYIYEKKWDSVLYFNTKSLEYRPDNVNMLHVRAVYDIKQGDYDKAMKISHSLITKNAHPGSILWLQGTIYRRLGMYDAGIQAMTPFMQTDKYPKTSRFVMLMADLYFLKGDYVSAEKLYARLLQQFPNDVEVALRFTETAHMAGKSDFAANVLAQLKSYPDKTEEAELEIRALELLIDGRTAEYEAVKARIEELHPDPDLEP